MHELICMQMYAARSFENTDLSHQRLEVEKMIIFSFKAIYSFHVGGRVASGRDRFD